MILTYFQKRATLTLPRLLTGHDVMRVLKLAPSPLIPAKFFQSVEEAQLDSRVKTRAQALRKPSSLT